MIIIIIIIIIIISNSGKPLVNFSENNFRVECESATEIENFEKFHSFAIQFWLASLWSFLHMDQTELGFSYCQSRQRLAGASDWIVHGGVPTAASKARRLWYSIDENDGSKVETWHLFHAETQQRCWTEEYWTDHVNKTYTAGLAHQRTTDQVSGYDVTRISASGSSYPTCVITEYSRKVVQLDQGDFRRSNDQFMVHHDQQLASEHALLIRQEGIPTTTADGLEFVQMEEDGFQQMSTMWIRPDQQTHVEQLWLSGSPHTVQIPPRPCAVNPGAMDDVRSQRWKRVWSERASILYKPLSELFILLRPDIAIKYQNRISTSELTICHETNMKASKQFKSSKYNNLNQNLLPEFSRCKLLSNTVEVSSLGFISDISEFSKVNLTEKMPDHVKQLIVTTVISDSYSIYCLRNVS